MHVVIAGCGRVGAGLALALAEADHDVVVIDKDTGAFRRLGEDFEGTALEGVAFDRPTLEKAGIRKAQAFLAVTSGDNSNIVSARTAKERYSVEHVVARIYDPERAIIYERFGITTIASARWTTDAILRVLLPAGERTDAGIGPGDGDVVLFTITVPEDIHGVSASRMERPGQFVLAAMTREGATTVPTAAALLETGDQLHIAVQRDAIPDLRETLLQLREEGA